MRSLKFIKSHSPCSTDYWEEGDGEGEFVCPNFFDCKQKTGDGEEIYCYRKLGHLVAQNALINSGQLGRILASEKQKFFRSMNVQENGKFWICYEEEWTITKGKNSVVDYVIKFAKIVLDGINGEWVNREKDGLRIETGPVNPSHLQGVLLEKGGQERIPFEKEGAITP